MKKKKQNYLTVIAVLTLIALIVFLIIIVKLYLNLASLQKQYNQEQTVNTYPYHCAFIAGSSDDDFWETVYQSAKEEGAQEGIYVEYFGQNLPISYTLEEKLKMAIAANVDAILVEPSGDFSATYLMNTAADSGIAVGTIYRDDLGSTRYNYTGVNNVSLGYEYGALAVEYSPESSNSFLVLLDEAEKNSERRLFTSGIGEALSDHRSNARLETKPLDETSAFDLEENIRQMLKEAHDTTDVIVCTTLLQTQYVSQLVIDMNYVGDFTIIGSYQNTSVLESLKNGVISACIVIDTQQMGAKAVDNLAEYLKNGHTSDYTQVTSHTITGKEAAVLLKATDSLQEGGNDEHET